jgi:CheY-like chemotaxis protein
MVLQGGWDLVFADIRMPVMRGDEMRGRIVAELGAQEPRIVAVTASALEHQRQQYLDEGFDGFIDKPFRAESIYASLADILGARFEFDTTAESVAGPPDLANLTLSRQVQDDLRESVRSHNVSLLRNTLKQMADAGGTQRDLARYLQ